MKGSLFIGIVILALSRIMVTPAAGMVPLNVSDDTGSMTPDKSEPGNSPIPRSHMDAGMQHIQEGRHDPRASMAPPNRDRNMSTNPDVAPMQGRDYDGEKTSQGSRGLQ
jgi:hypothetical protein